MNDQINDAGTKLAQLANRPSDSMTPFLVFGDESGMPINEIALAPGEERTIQVILYQHPEVITQALQADWNMYDSNHKLTTGVTCKKEGDEWMFPLGLSTNSKAVGGMRGNVMKSSEPLGTWRCYCENETCNQFWYPRDQFTTPVAVAEFTVIASSDWTDAFATFELDSSATKFVMTHDTAVSSNNKTVTQCDYNMVLTIKNSASNAVSPAPNDQNNGENTPPQQEGNAPDGPITTFEGKPLVSKFELRTLINTYGPSSLYSMGRFKMIIKLKFIYNTFRLKKEANGEYVKEQGRRNVISEQEYVCPIKEPKQPEIYYLPLEEGEYLENAETALVSYYNYSNRGDVWRPDWSGLLDASSGEIDLVFSSMILSGALSPTMQRIYMFVKSKKSSVRKDNLRELPSTILNEETAKQQRREEEKRKKKDEEERKKAEEERKKKEEEDRKKAEEERKRREEEERKKREEENKQRIMEQLNSLINKYPLVSVEDGYDREPVIHQDANDTGAWVRARRETKRGTWFMVDKGMNEQYIYPGNVIMVDKDQNFTKNLVEIPFFANERKPLRLDAKYSNDLPKSSTELSSFTRADVNAFVASCLTQFKNSQHDLASDTSWNYERCERKEGITIGGTIKGVKFAGSIGRNKTVTVAYLRQVMYTVSLNNEYSRPSDIFTDKVDISKLQSNINKTPGATPAVIDAVKYGRIITLWIVQEGNEPATLSIDSYFNMTIGRTNNSTKYYMYVLGGIAGGDNNPDIYTASQDDFKKAVKNMKEVGREAIETAKPIEFSVKYLANMTTNVEWKVLPWYKSYLPEIKFRIKDDNTGATMHSDIYYLDYEVYGNNPMYRLHDAKRKKLTWDFKCSPKALCFDIKIDVMGATDPHDFNAMLPCIPYDQIKPNEDGEFVFEISFYGTTLWDKKFQCKPTVHGAVLSTSNKEYMYDDKNSPQHKFKNTSGPERAILQDYKRWADLMTEKKCMSYQMRLDSLGDLRPEYID